MTVSTEISSNEYTGNGVTTDFDYKFRVFDAAHLSVITSDAEGDNVVSLRLNTDYRVTGVKKSAGGKVILNTPLANGNKISIARSMPTTQETSFKNQGSFFAESHEDAFDKLTMLLQRIWGSLGTLYLRRPNILANWFDAKGYRIANLGKPKSDSDAVDLGTLKDEIEGVNGTILKREKRLLRVDDMDIAALPKASDRAGNVLTFDKDGKPIVVAPASGSAVDVLNQLEKGDGSLVGIGNNQTLKDRLSEYLTTSSFNIKGGAGTGCVDALIDAIEKLKAAKQPLRFVNGEYYIEKNITIDIPVEVPFGAVIKVDKNATLKLNSEFNAGLYHVFETEDDFYADPKAKTSVKFTNHEVKPEWFGAKTTENILDILTVQDSSHAILKSFRAAIGDFVNPNGNDLWSEFPYSNVVLANGCYRCDRPIQFGYQERIDGTMVRYKTNGSGMQGKGSGLSLLVFTDSEYKGNAHFIASYMSGEMHKYNGFKVAFCNPNLSGSDRFYSYAGAMMLFTSIDSIETSDLWASGSYYSYVNSDNVVTGGVGIQFESLTDHRYRDILTEHNVHGVAFSSCLSNGSNIKGFFNKHSDISFGNFIPAWGAQSGQLTTNTVSLAGFKSKACYAFPIYFGTKENYVNIDGVTINGLGESSTIRTTVRAIGFNPKGGGAYGEISGKVISVNYGLLTDNGTSFAGKLGAKLTLNFVVKDATAASSSETAVVNIQNTESNIDLTMSLDGTSRLPAVRNFSLYTSVSLSLRNVKNATGAIGFINHENGQLNIREITESGGDGVWLGYVSGGRVLLPVIYSISNSKIRNAGGVVIRSTADNYPDVV